MLYRLEAVDLHILGLDQDLGQKPNLTGAHIEIITLIALGYTNKRIAALRRVSTVTVNKQTREIYLRLDANGRRQAVAKASELGFINLGEMPEVKGLTCRQTEVLDLARTEPTAAAIATRLHISERTVRRHFSDIRRNSGLSLPEAVLASSGRRVAHRP